MSRREAILSLVVMGRREGSGHLEKMAMSSSAECFFLCGGLWDGAAESVMV